MAEPAPARDLDRRIAERLAALRAGRGLSLDALAGRSGVSRSMISLIERGESSPTAVVLDKLAAGLGVTLPSLFDAPADEPTADGPVARREDQPQWRDPASGYLRRSVSPPGVPQPMQIVEVVFPPRARVAFENPARELCVHQQVWVLDGAIDVSSGRQRHRLRKGDCLAMQLDRPSMFYNPTRKPARYAVVIASDAAPAMTAPGWSLRRVQAASDADVGGLADVLIDCVEGGASVSFMDPLPRERALAFWRGVARDVEAGKRALWVADDAHGVCGTVHLIFDLPENQPHRADLTKMLVHRRARRQGIGAALLRAAETTAREYSRTLLVLDTASDDAERVYERGGWVRVGVIPGFALWPRGGLCDTTVYYRELGR